MKAVGWSETKGDGTCQDGWEAHLVLGLLARLLLLSLELGQLDLHVVVAVSQCVVCRWLENV